MTKTVLLIPNKFYHIYNRSINGCKLFNENDNYEHFLRLYDKHISPVAETYAWVLMGNHFHLLVRIKTPVEFQNPQGYENLEGLTYQKRIYQQFSNLFNAYSKAFNKKYNRTGSLFEHPFKRKEINSLEYLKKTLVYIHQNPVKHGFCDHAIKYGWSSYLTCISDKETKLMRQAVMDWFEHKEKFIEQHNEAVDADYIVEWT